MTLKETVIHNGQTLYAPMVACRPVRITDYPPELQEIHRRVVADAGVPEMSIYPGSTITRCERCNIEVGVGPRQQQAVELAHSLGLLVHTLCVVHAAFVASETTDETVVVSLNNPYQRRSDDPA